jgi:hypothetical protein
MSIFNFFSRKQLRKDVAFWNWFQKNEARLYDFEKEQDRIFMELRREIDKYHPGLAFEFGPKIEGVRDFVISAEGMKADFPFVTALADAAPALPKWKIIKFRPKREPFPEIEYEGVNAKIDEIRFSIEPDGDKPGITLYFDHFDESQQNAFIGITFLYLDNCLGEFDVATKVGFIEAKPASDPSRVTTLRLTDLPATFDRFVAIRSN